MLWLFTITKVIFLKGSSKISKDFQFWPNWKSNHKSIGQDIVFGFSCTVCL
jgi:hypothetical protein